MSAPMDETVPIMRIGDTLLIALQGDLDDSAVVRAGDYLLGHLQLFFVPAGAGVVVYLTMLREHALPVLTGLLGT